MASDETRDAADVPTRASTRRRAAALGAGGLALYLILLNACAGPLRVDPLAEHSAPLIVDDRLDVARRYAPVIYHAMHPEKGRQDIPARVDFDGDLRGDNSWEHFPRYRLRPTVYYAVLETATHLFVSYHLHHPRDWSYVRIGVHLTHENDGENLQVVVERESGRVVALYTQAHYWGFAYSNGALTSGDVALDGEMLLLDDDLRPSPDGRRAGVFVEWGGHGIYGAAHRGVDVTVAADGRATFADGGRVFRVAREGEVVDEPSPVGSEPVPYQLESTTAKLWPRLKDGSLVGKGGLLDGAVPYRGRMIDVDVPRYYEADRFSGPLGPDRGISPFALDFDFDAGGIGALFFDPAARWKEKLRVPEPWSLEYLEYPFR